MTEQMSLFNQTQIRSGDEVKVILKSEEDDQLAHDYMKHYYPHCINRRGRVVGISNNSLQVSCEGEMLILNEDDVIFLR
ncbi:hypothetical protein MKX79_03730 [Viridibacillus sp. FSL R5-0468]|uniref:hypothetical protein n=1 Tax=Viridibacillus sp. FSL R5-0468 TaxID=2921640 RepID=UPI0030F9F4E7